MRRIKGGKLEINSAYEALIIGRAAAYGKKDEADNVIIKHRKDIDNTRDEAVFLSRSLEFKEDPIISATVTSTAVKGLKAIVEQGKAYRSIRPEVAEQFLAIYMASEQGPKSEYTQLPEAELTARINEHYPPGLSLIAAQLIDLEVKPAGPVRVINGFESKVEAA